MFLYPITIIMTHYAPISPSTTCPKHTPIFHHINKIYTYRHYLEFPNPGRSDKRRTIYRVGARQSPTSEHCGDPGSELLFRAPGNLFTKLSFKS